MAETKPAAKNLYQRRSPATWAALLGGVPVAAVILFLVLKGPLRETVAHRYLSHEVEAAELILFCCAASALLAKLWSWRNEAAALRAAGRGDVLPEWDGQPVPPDQAAGLLARLDRLPTRLRNTLLVCRLGAALDFVRNRNAANDLDDQLRALADNDALALDGSYSLTRFITWA